jgi:hypothetical protein
MRSISGNVRSTIAMLTRVGRHDVAHAVTTVSMTRSRSEPGQDRLVDVRKGEQRRELTAKARRHPGLNDGRGFANSSSDGIHRTEGPVTLAECRR